MFALTTSHRFQLYSEATDMRKGFDGLCAIVEHNLNQDVTTSGVFVFINKRRDKIKLLHWTGVGFVLYYKRLEKGTFEFPKYDAKDSSIKLSYAQLVMLIDGITILNTKQKPRYSSTIISE